MKQKGIGGLIAIIIVFVIVGAVALFFVYRQPNSGDSNMMPQKPMETGEEGMNNNVNDETSGMEYMASEISPVDDTFNLYENHEYGYSIEYPKKYATGFAACEWNADEESYRPGPGEVNSTIFETDDKSKTYITQETIHELSQEEYKDGITYYGSCGETENSLETVSLPDSRGKYGWGISAYKVAGTDGIENVIKELHGPGCELGELKETSVAGVYDVTLKYPGNPDDDPEMRQNNGCFVNYAFVMKYNSDTNVVVAWDLGQAASFYKELDTGTAYDTEMVNSFEFVKNPL